MCHGQIEEPPEHTLFILVTDAPEKLLPTIRSRCQTVRYSQETKAPRGIYYEKLQSVFSGKKPSFIEITALCDEIHKAFEAKRKALETQSLSLSKETLKEMNAQQRQKVDQEMEGQVSSKWQQEVVDLLLDIALFFRDEHKKNPQSVPLEKVQDALVFTKLAIERSTPLKNALESLFLRMKAEG